MTRHINEKEDIKKLIINIHSLYLHDQEQIIKCSKILGLSLNTIDQAKRYGKGSINTHVSIFCWGVQVSPSKLINIIPQLKNITKCVNKVTYFDELLMKALQFYSIDELIATLQLLIDVYKVEFRQIRKKRLGRPPKK